LNRKGLAVGLILLFIVSIVAPMTLGHDINNTTDKRSVNNSDDFTFRRFDKYFFPESYSSEKNRFEIDVSNVTSEVSTFSKEAVESHSIGKKSTPLRNPCSGPMDSPWSMYCHDVRHTGRSPYSTVNTWDEIWHVKDETYYMHSSPVIDNDGTIYCSALELYAVDPNGTVKWTFDTSGYIWSAPAIDENGVIYFGTMYGDPSCFYAVYPNGTLKWKYSVGDCVQSSPAIGDDGTIYFGSDNKYVYAFYSNGTLKWKYLTGHLAMSSPAIGLDDTIYYGVLGPGYDEGFVYAFNPNGTVKWTFNAGTWVHGSAAIGDDGIVYIGSDDSFYAIYPNNGTMKWHLSIGGGIWSTPVIDENGIIYFGGYDGNFYAIYPNGTIKWTFPAGGNFWFGASAAISTEGTLYFASGNFFALYPDGTEKWRFHQGSVFSQSSPAIGEDGIVYMTFCANENHGGNIYTKGYLYAFGIGPLEADANGPYYGLINQPVQFKGSSSGGYSPYSYHWDFGDGGISEEQNPTHIYTSASNYTVTLTVTDNTSNTSSDTTWAWIQATNTPPNKPGISGPTKGEYGISYDYNFMSSDPDGTPPIWYYVDWGDNSNTGWFGPYSSNEEVVKSHFWYEKGTYTISCKAKDPYNAEGDWGTLSVTMPCSYDKPIMNFLEKILERFPHAFPILRYILGQYKTFF
jgi:outer membrane protein assembly factor BamB